MTAIAHGLSGWEATTALARLALRRILRGKTMWVALAVSLLPCLIAVLVRANSHDAIKAWTELLKYVLPLIAIIPPILVASSLSDEIDEKTAAYLWSRALPRWSVVTGKLLGLAPIAAGAIALGMALSWLILGGPTAVPSAMFGRTILGLAAGTVAASVVSAMFATLAPRFAVPLAIGWLLFDSLIGSLSMNLHAIAVSFGARAIARDVDVATGAISLLVLTTIALIIALRRIDRIE